MQAKSWEVEKQFLVNDRVFKEFSADQAGPASCTESGKDGRIPILYLHETEYGR